MANNPPDQHNPVMDHILSGLGLTADANINWQASMSPEDFATAQAAAEAALQLIVDPASHASTPETMHAKADQGDSGNNNWSMLTGPQIADFGRDYFFRALIANKGLGANLAVDAIYPSCFLDSYGITLKNTRTYTLTFEANQLPPVNGFWSVKRL